MDVAKQVEYWRTGSDEDIAAPDSLLEKRHLRHALFFAHLAVEKMLKAHVTRVTGDVPPKIHDLLRLSTIAAIDVPEDRRRFLGRFQKYCLEGRYAASWPPPPTRQEVESGLSEAQETLQWLKSQL